MKTITIHASDFKECDRESLFYGILYDLGFLLWNGKYHELNAKGKEQFPDIEDWEEIDSIEIKIDEITDYSY